MVGPASGDSSEVQLSDATLGHRLASGDINALDQVFVRYNAAVQAVAYRVTNDRTFAEDVAQDVFVSLWTNPSRYQPERGSIGTWLMAAAHNKAVDLVRHEESHKRRRAEVAARAEQQLREDSISELYPRPGLALAPPPLPGRAGPQRPRRPAGRAARGDGACLFRRLHPARGRRDHRGSPWHREDANVVCHAQTARWSVTPRHC